MQLVSFASNISHSTFMETIRKEARKQQSKDQQYQTELHTRMPITIARTGLQTMDARYEWLSMCRLHDTETGISRYAQVGTQFYTGCGYSKGDSNCARSVSAMPIQGPFLLDCPLVFWFSSSMKVKYSDIISAWGMRYEIVHRIRFPSGLLKYVQLHVPKWFVCALCFTSWICRKMSLTSLKQSLDEDRIRLRA